MRICTWKRQKTLLVETLWSYLTQKRLEMTKNITYQHMKSLDILLICYTIKYEQKYFNGAIYFS